MTFTNEFTILTAKEVVLAVFDMAISSSLGNLQNGILPERKMWAPKARIIQAAPPLIPYLKIHSNYAISYLFR